MATTSSIKIEKTMPFRGVTRTWSNRYHFLGGTPPDQAHWQTLADAITAAEKAILNSSCHIVKAVGYAAGSDVPVFDADYNLAGTYAAPSLSTNMGEVAALARWSTDVRTKKNHPIYLFSYWHGVDNQGSGALDTLGTAQKNAMQTYANLWTTGFSDGATTYNRAGPNGAAGFGAVIDQFLTVHVFPR